MESALNTHDKKMVDISRINQINNEILKFLEPNIKTIVQKVNPEFLSSIEEIRLRAGRPLMMENFRGDWFIDRNSRLDKSNVNSFVISSEDIIKTLGNMSENSIYAYQDEIRNGFLTLRGGHRVGIVGKVIHDGITIKNIKDISGLNIRISREFHGCSSIIAKQLIHKSNLVYNTLIVSPPQCGKTTIIRDLARNLSNGMESIGFKGLKVGIVDERSEIAACYRGVPQNDVGARTDVLDGCPKAAGMLIMLRSMSPKVIITDEIGNRGDRDAVLQVLNSGVKIITTAHGVNVSELKMRRELLELMEENVFERYVVLSNMRGPGTLEEVLDGFTMKSVKTG